MKKRERQGEAGRGIKWEHVELVEDVEMSEEVKISENVEMTEEVGLRRRGSCWRRRRYRRR
jgi:hypothetical protein